MKELGITKGDWNHHKKAKGTIVNDKGRTVATCMGYSTNSDNGEHIEENYANGDLIADAGTTSNKCNLMPSELLERYNEAIEVLEKIKEESRTLKSLIKSLHLYEHATTYNFELEYKDYHYDADTSFLEAQKELIESEQTISKAHGINKRKTS